jgi:gliding motility-associated-like protein
VVKGDGGTSFSFKTLDVFPNPTASFKLAPAEAMLPEAKVQFYNTSSNGTLFRWEFGDIAGLSSEKNPSYTYTKLGSYDVKLQVTSENGCVDDTLIKSAVRVVGQGLLKFPNAFIPSSFGGNGGAYELPDYKNEVFHPVSEGVVTYKLIVYNRWGELLFSSNDLTVGWDGYSKGKLCEQGVYVYRATGKYTNGKSFDIKGDLTLLR